MPHSATVIPRSRRGVTQVQLRVPSHARTPVAPVTATAAVAMHWAHMGRS
jgi:hypothetical protein